MTIDELRAEIVGILRLHGIRERQGNASPESVADSLLTGPLAPVLDKLRAVKELIAEEGSFRADFPAWEITVAVPVQASDETVERIFDAVAGAAYEAQPEDRTDWDVFVSATKNPTSVPTHLLRRALDVS